MADRTTYAVKLAVVGDTGVGKSSVSGRFAQGSFSENAETTIGAAFLAATVDRSTHRVKFQIWDTAGQERYRALAPLYYRHAHVVMVVYDISSRGSFEAAKRWKCQVTAQLARAPIYALVGNKADLGACRKVSTSDGEDFAQNEGMRFAEVSAKTGDGVHTLFEELADCIPELEGDGGYSSGLAVVDDSGQTEGSWTSCCY
jgi:small GTP-binding protein